MATITIERAKVLTIVGSKDEHTRSLFEPINGRTADGYVVKRARRFCDVWINGEVLRVNGDLVFCRMTKQADGRTWFSYSDLPFTCGAQHDAAMALVKGSEWKGGRIVRYFAD